MRTRPLMILGLLGVIGLASTVAVAQQQSDVKADPTGLEFRPVQVQGADYYQVQGNYGGMANSILLPQGGASQNQATKLANQYVKSEKEDEKKEIRKKLQDLLAQQFDQHMEQQQKELKELEKQLESLKTLLKKRADGKSNIIDRRLEQMLQDASGLGWTAPANIRVNPSVRMNLDSPKK